MSIITLPANATFTQLLFNWNDGVKSIRSGSGGVISAIGTHDGYWSVEATVAPLWAYQRREWEAFFLACNGPMNGFYLHSDRHAWPLAHEGGFSGFDGNASLSAYESDGDITLSGLPSGYIITAGDHISFSRSTRRALMVSTTETVTVGGGGTARIAVRGSFDSAYFTPATTAVKLYSAPALLRLSSYDLPKGVGPEAISFTAESSLI
jgi:hypothetical protein